MKIPIWDDWLCGGDTFTSLLTSVRFIWCAGYYGSGKTMLATFLAAHLLHVGKVSRVVSNLHVVGASPAAETVPGGIVYESPYLVDKDNNPRRFYPGDMFPLEDTAILFDEAAMFIDDWQSAKDYFIALRKTNLYFLMPSIWPPVARVRYFEVRRTLNLYVFGIPAWQYTWFLSNGRSVAEKGTFYFIRPSRMFGVFATLGLPKDDGGIADMLRYTFETRKIENDRNTRAIARKIAAIGGYEEGSVGSTASADALADTVGQISDATTDLVESFASADAWDNASGKRSKRR